MDDQAVGLVNDHEIIVFKQDFQGNVLRFIVERDSFRQDDCDAITKLDRIARLRGVTVDLDVLFADERLDARPGEIRQAGREKGVDALARIVFD